MKISKRLEIIANCVPKNTGTVVDVGTDHGYIPIYLIQYERAKRCIACDINPGPLQNAQNNINHYHMGSAIETRLGNGLSPIAVGETDAIIIAGMGGMLIIDILRDATDLVKGVGLLILQAQLDIESLRRYLHFVSFKIEEEKMLEEDGKFYTVILAKPGAEKRYTNKEYLLGKKLIEKKDPLLKDFLLYKMKTNNELMKQLSVKNTKQTKKRFKQIDKENALYKEVLACL